MRARWLDAAAQCPWDMRTPKSWTAAGWVYVLRQPTDRWYRNRASKIGLTYRDPAVRAKELFTTALPRPLNVEFALFAPNMAKLECDVHARLARRLADETQEVFHVELRDAIRAVVETFYEEMFLHEPALTKLHRRDPDGRVAAQIEPERIIGRS